MKLLDYLSDMPQEDVILFVIGVLLVLVFMSERVWYGKKEDPFSLPPERPRKRFQGPSDPERVKPRKRV